MRSRNGALAAGLAAVGAMAVVGGGVVAARQGPSADNAVAAGPLRNSSPESLGTKVELSLDQLPEGRAPQVAYLTGRVVGGGAGPEITVPGKQNILGAARYDGSLLVILEVGTGGAELAWIADSSGFEPKKRIPDVQSLVLSLDEDAVAYATARSNPDHTRARGNTVYWEGPGTEGTETRILRRPKDWASTVLGVVGEKVYFSSDTDPNGTTSALSVWDSATDEVQQIKAVKSPEGVNLDGTAAVDFVAGGAQTFCSAVTDLSSGSRRWRSCEYSVEGFTPDGRTALGAPDFRGGGSDPLLAALDASNGNVLREWSGAQFLETVAEDDDHLLAVTDTGEGTPGAIVRCTISTGSCELATPLSRTQRYDVRLLGAWS